MTFHALIAIVTVLWLVSIVACAMAFRWTFKSMPRRFLAAVILSLAALFIGYLGMTQVHLVVSKTVNGQTQWHFDAKWFFIVTLLLGASTLAYTLWKKTRPGHATVPELHP
jgi:NO-binding membrane sensor protein with MHYT domain